MYMSAVLPYYILSIDLFKITYILLHIPLHSKFTKLKQLTLRSRRRAPGGLLDIALHMTRIMH